MAIITPLYQRVTRKYRDGWQHLDQHELVGYVKELDGERVLREHDGIDGGRKVQFRVVALSRYKRRDLSNALRDSYAGTSCRHEHDCCGCAIHYATVKRISARDYIISVTTNFNY